MTWVTARAFLELGKLRLSGMAVFAVLAGLYLGAERPVPLRTWIGTTLGTMLIAVASAAFNMLVERDLDRHMPRTAGRPLPTGRVSQRGALGFGLVAAAAGIATLVLCSNWLATGLCTLILVLYVFVYTPLKRHTTLNTLVGAVPGALPPVVGYAASAGRLDQAACILFLILFFWQVPHFLAIAWRYRQDYAQGGMKMLPVEDAGGQTTARQMIAYTAALVVASLSAPRMGLGGQLYTVLAGFLGLLFLVPVLIAAVRRNDEAMRLCFLSSIVYLPALLIAMMLDTAAARAP